MIAQHNFGIHSNLLWFHLAVIIASTLRTRLQDGQLKVAWVQAKVGQQHAVAGGDHVAVEVPQNYFVCTIEREREIRESSLRIPIRSFTLLDVIQAL